jgi:antitoxin component YwqK of YwqJK toxin-antitoxin module
MDLEMINGLLLHGNGNKESEGYFLDDKQTGTWEYFYPTTEKWKQGNFENDLKTGVWTTWFENGKKLQEGLMLLVKKMDNGKAGITMAN